MYFERRFFLRLHSLINFFCRGNQISLLTSISINKVLINFLMNFCYFIFCIWWKLYSSVPYTYLNCFSFYHLMISIASCLLHGCPTHFHIKVKISDAEVTNWEMQLSSAPGQVNSRITHETFNLFCIRCNTWICYIFRLNLNIQLFIFSRLQCTGICASNNNKTRIESPGSPSQYASSLKFTLSV